MKAVPLDALRLVPPRNRQQLGDARHVAVKHRVKAGDLWQMWMTIAKRLHQLDLEWQVIGCIGNGTMQFVEHVWRDSLRFRTRASVDYAMSHGCYRRELVPRSEPVNQESRCWLVVRHLRVTIAGRAFRRSP